MPTKVSIHIYNAYGLDRVFSGQQAWKKENIKAESKFSQLLVGNTRISM